MSRSWVSLALVALISTNASAREDSNPLFGYTHLLPSPLTIGSGRFALGTVATLGFTDFLQFSTDIVEDFYRVFNARFDATVLDFQAFALGASLGFQFFNYNDLSPNNPPLQSFTVSPGAVAGVQILSNLALFAGGNLSFTTLSQSVNGLDTAGFVRGAVVESDLSWAYNPEKQKLGSLLSAGVSYDLTYGIIGYGLSHHWPHFQLGFHYYPGATTLKFLPILSGGISGRF